MIKELHAKLKEKTKMRTRTIILLLAIVAFLASVTGGYSYYRVSRNSLLKEAHYSAELQTRMVADHIRAHLSEFQKGVKTLAGMTDMRQALTRKDSESILGVNSVLDHFYEGLGVSVCYLMDATGNTLASSNRNTPKSFVGKNYAFRPYFQKAQQGIPTTYMALGVTSGIQGVYYSHPVYGSDKTLPLGVVVIKAFTKALEHEIDLAREGIMLFTDPDGVIFLSSRKDWQYKILWKVSAQTISKIARTSQFGQGSLSWVGLKRKNEHLATDLSGKEFHLHQGDINNYKGWQVVFLHDHHAVIKRVGQPLFRTMGIAIFTALLFIGLALLMLYRNASHGIRQQAKTEQVLKESEERYRLLYQTAQEGILVAQDGMIKFPNPQALKLYDWPEEILTTKSLTEFIHEEDRQMVRERHQARLRGEKPPETYPFRIVTQAGEVKWVELRVAPITWENKPAALCFMTDITARKQAQAESEKLISDLKEAMAKVKTLRGLLPVCANCKKIRDDGGYWNRIETYIEDHSEAEFSHSICPECERELYPEFFEEDE